MSITATFTAGQTQEWHGVGDFFRILDSTGPVTVKYYYQGREVAEAVGMLTGYGERFTAQKFDRIRITSASAQTITFVIRDGAEVRYDRGAASVVVTNTAGAFTQAQRTVTNASAQMLAANTARRYLMIQNKDASGDIWVNLAGAAATTANGLLIPAGGSLELQGFVCTGAVFAIGSIASNANIVSVEG
jgi:hypothetical protein